MQRIEEQIVRAIVSEAAKANWFPAYVDDGGARVSVSNIDQVIEAVDSVCDSHILFRKVGCNTIAYVYIVLGNGIDCFSDFSMSGAGFTEAMEAASEIVEALDVEESYRMQGMEAARGA